VTLGRSFKEKDGVEAMTNVRWAFAGSGRQPRLWIAPAVAGAANAETIGVWSQRRTQGELFAKEQGISRVYDTFEELLADPESDAVFIATPNNLHATHAIAALRAGKHVLVEKPMASSIAEAREMVQVARSQGRLLGVGFHLRHHALVVEARRRVVAGEIGEIQHVTAQFNLSSAAPPRLTIPSGAWKQDPEQMGGAGALFGMGVHLIDLVRCLTGQEIAAVTALAVGTTPERPLENFGQALLEFSGGAQGHILYGGRFPLSRNDVVLYGSKGRLIGERLIDVSTTGALHITWPEGATGTRTESLRLDLIDHYQRQIEAFSEAISTRSSFAADGEDGLRAVEVATAIIESHSSGRRIIVGTTKQGG